jgi:putative transposase
VSTSAHVGFVLDAFEQADHERPPAKGIGLVYHSDRGSQYMSIRYTEHLAEAGIEPSVRSVGDSNDNALADTINGLFRAEVIRRFGPWCSFEAFEYATLEMGGMVQQPPLPQIDWEYPARQSQGQLLFGSGNRTHGHVTNVN